MPVATELSADIPLFSLLTDEERLALGQQLEEQHAAQDSAIFSIGDPGDRLYLVRSGSVELSARHSTGEKIVFATMGAGEIFGELALFDTGPRTASATALEDTELLVLDRAALQFFVRQKPDAALQLLATMAKRLRAADELIRYHSPKNSNEEIDLELSWVQKTANFIAEYSGSMSFLFFNAAFFTVWIGINLNFLPGVHAFDPFPFGLLTMAVSLEAIFLSIFVLLAQNIQTAKDRIRGDIEYEVNLRAELEVAELHRKVDKMHERILDRLERVERTAPRP